MGRLFACFAKWDPNFDMQIFVVLEKNSILKEGVFAEEFFGKVFGLKGDPCRSGSNCFFNVLVKVDINDGVLLYSVMIL